MRKKKLALNSGIQIYQILANDNEVCFQSLSIIILALLLDRYVGLFGLHEAMTLHIFVGDAHS